MGLKRRGKAERLRPGQTLVGDGHLDEEQELTQNVKAAVTLKGS